MLQVVVLNSLTNLLPAVQAQNNDIPLVDESSNNKLIALGIIGVRVETDHRLDKSAESHSNSGIVKFIYKGSLADGRLAINDVIVGVNGESFKKDFSKRMAAAIDWSEGNTGKLQLSITRNNKPLDVTFEIPLIGSFSKTYPYNCKKSDFILESACDWLVRHQNAEGRLDNGGYIVNSAIAGLALLGSGNPKYTKSIQLLAQTLISKFDAGLGEPGQSLITWQVNYGAIFLAEYFLATGDSRVLPTLAILNKRLKLLQFIYMPQTSKKDFEAKNQPIAPFWFGHGMPQKTDGYAALGVNVANALLSWELLSQCGIPIDRDNYNKTRDYVEVAGPRGEMPYASAPKQRGGDGDAFGRTGVLSLSYYLCADRPEYSNKINESLRRIQKDNYFTSHASSDLGKMWGTLGIAALDAALLHESMNENKFSYSLIRLSDGSFTANPEMHFQNGGTNIDFEKNYGRAWTTACNALIFALSQKKLRITGSNGIPGFDVENLKSRNVLKLAEYGRLGKYGDAAKLAKKIISDEKASESEIATAKFVSDYITNKTKPTVKELDAIKSSRDFYTLKQRVAEIKRTYEGVEIFDTLNATIDEELKNVDVRKELLVGAKYYALADTWYKTAPDQRLKYKEKYISNLEKFADRNEDSIYGKAARSAITALNTDNFSADPFRYHFETK